jgi:replication factor A1
MSISELNAGQGNVAVEGTITEVGESRTFSKFGKEMTVANAILKDDSGTIKLSLWNEDASKYKEGDKIKIENGYVNEFQGEMQLTAGKFGKMEKVGEGDASSEASAEGESSDSSQEALPSEEATEEAEVPAEEASEEAPTEESEEADSEAVI